MGGALDLVGHFGVGIAFLEGFSFRHGLLWRRSVCCVLQYLAVVCVLLRGGADGCGHGLAMLTMLDVDSL